MRTGKYIVFAASPLVFENCAKIIIKGSGIRIEQSPGQTISKPTMIETDFSGPPILKLLRADGLLRTDHARAIPLTGGVSSDVFLVEDGPRKFVVKQALAKIKVHDLWQADISRNRTEFEYLNFVGRVLPEAVPKVFAAGDGYFTMEYLGEGFANWKQMLLLGQCRCRSMRRKRDEPWD